MMNTFDFIQFTLPTEIIKSPNLDRLATTWDVNDQQPSYSLRKGMKMLSNYDLNVIFNLGPSNSTIGFSAKILGKNYPDLISKLNFEDCLRHLSTNFQLCAEIDIEAALRWGACTKLEVTQDIEMELDKVDYQSITNLVSNPGKWSPSRNDKGNSLRNGFGVINGKESLRIYGKGVEMSKQKNQSFVSECGLEERFNGYTRIEVRLNSAKAIRNRLLSNNLKEVLESTVMLQEHMLKEIFPDSPAKNIAAKFTENQRDRERLAYAEQFGCDFSAIGLDLKQRDPRNWKRHQTAIRKVVARNVPKFNETLSLIESIKSSLSARSN
jgi:hypothetical protein